ncbi:MAG: HD domain-containing protein [Clostridia bacterium]|nr:HD domain-containing protein [Clostridia bacterium]
MKKLHAIFEQPHKSSLEIAEEIVNYYRTLSRDVIKNTPQLLSAINNWYQSIVIDDNNSAIRLRIGYCNVYYYRISGDGENVFRWGLKSVYDYPSYEDAPYVGWIHRLISAMAFAMGLIDQATDHANRALQLFLALDDDDEIIRSYIQLGIAYDFTENYELQLDYFDKAYQLAKSIHAEETTLIALNNTIFVHILREEFEIAKEKIVALEEGLASSEMSRLVIGSKLNATRIALHDKDLSAVKNLLDQVRASELLKTDLSMYLDSFLLYGRYYSQLGQVDESMTAYTKGLNKAISAKSKKYQLEFLHDLATLNKNLKNYKAALKNQEDYINTTKEIAHEHAGFHYLFLRIQYEIDQIHTEVNHLKNQLNQTQETTIYTLATLAEYKDQITGKHILRTIEYVEAFCQLMNEHHILTEPFEQEFINNFSRSSALHDIGKVGISDSILKKPGKLSTDEFDQMKQHTIIGRDALSITENIMQQSSFLKLAEIIAFSHHEKWDGSGYPLGLKAEEIPLVGRIVAIIDVYDALISRRPYKPPYSHLKAIAILEEGRGTHFDPALVDVFLTHHEVFYNIAKRLLDSDDEKKVLVSDTE